MKKNEGIEKVLEQIRNVLIVIAVIMLINVIVIAIGNNYKNTSTYSGNSDSGSKDSGSTEGQEQQLPEYDVTAFTEVTVDEMFNKVSTSGYQVVYIGRSGCGYCRLFLDALKQAQTNFNYKTLYIDLDKVTTDGATKMRAISDEVSKNFGSTPMVIVYKDGKYQDMWLGYDEYSAFEKYLLNLGMTK